MQLKNSSAYLFVFFILLLNLALKFIFIDARDIAMDEPFSLFYAQQSPQEIINYFNNANENNPPLYFLILHYWITLWGDSALSVRFLSVLFSSLTAVVIFATGKKFFNPIGGAVAALIFTFSTLHIYYSHETRTYTLFALLNALSLYFYLSIISKPRDKKNYIFLFLSNLVLIYSHYFGFFVLFTELICFLAVPNKKQLWKGVAVLFIALFACYLPHLPALLGKFLLTTNSGTWVAPPALTEYYGNLNRFLNNKYCMALLIAIFIFTSALLIKNKKIVSRAKEIISDTNLKIIFLWFLISYTLMFLLSFKLPMFIDRYILYTSIPFYLFISVLVCLLADRKIYRYSVSGALLTGLIFTVQLNPDNNRRLKEATDEVKKLKKENTRVLVAPEYADLGFAYHYQINFFRDYKNMRGLLAIEKVFPVNSAEMAATILSDQTGDCIYFQADTKFTDPDNLILQCISKKYSNHTEKNIFEIYTIHHFSN